MSRIYFCPSLNRICQVGLSPNPLGKQKKTKSSSHMLSTKVSGVRSCISQRFCNYITRSRLRLSRIFLATTALRHSGLQSKSECRSSISSTYSKQEVRRRKLHYLKAKLAKSWSAWRWGADRNQGTRTQRHSERGGNWDICGDRDSKLRVEMKIRVRASKNEKCHQEKKVAKTLAAMRMTEGSIGWRIGAGQSTENLWLRRKGVRRDRTY